MPHSGACSDDFLRSRFRAGSEYELVVYDRLAPEEQALFAELRPDADFYGIFRPLSGRHRTFKVADRQTALLWLTLQEPGPWPSFAVGRDRDETRLFVMKLVLDGIVEVEWEQRFVTGARAAALLPGHASSNANFSSGKIGVLSSAALRYAERLRLTEHARLAERLYGFGRQPLTPIWAAQLANSDTVLNYLGAATGTALHARLRAEFHQSAGPSAWIHWTNRSVRVPRGDEAHYKLYVSPRIDALPRVFPVVMDVAVKLRAHFKIGSNAPGLLRPDKCVLYVADQETVYAAGAELSHRLADVPAQGVPFTAAITAEGLLSWGLDPPAADRTVSWIEMESWRVWIVRRLAAALISAQAEDSGAMTPAQFAIERLRLEGVDVAAWTPSGRAITTS